jgi:antirestriction protein ArdC
MCSSNHPKSTGGNTLNTEKKDIYQRVTDQIVKAIEDGAGTYKMPWRTSGGFAHSPINAVSKKPYRGINVLVLWATAQEKGYTSGTWATYKQWQEMGCQVRKGEKSANVVFWKFFDGEESEQSEAEKPARRVPMARDYWVFNAHQVDGYKPLEEEQRPPEERISDAEAFFRNVGVKIADGGNRAYYLPSTDAVYMPAFAAFAEPIAYYSVLSHETTHWSGAAHRVNRDLTGRFGTESYAAEELVAELGAAFLCAELGLPTDPREDHAPYIASWLKVLKNDKRAIFTASAHAQRAVDFLQGFQEPKAAAA